MDDTTARTFVEQRRERIADLLRSKGRIGVSELADSLGISPLTARRDLAALEHRGIAQRRYGEAVLAEGAQGGTASQERIKDTIARTAAALVENDELLFINTSSTALKVVEHIAAHGVTVVTNSAQAHDLSVPTGGMVLITGGEVRPPRGVLSGEFAMANIRSVAATTCFVGCAGISVSAGVTSTTQLEATINALMVERADRFVLLADSSKIGVGAGFSYARLSDIDLLITDAQAREEDIEALLEAGVKHIQRV